MKTKKYLIFSTYIIATLFFLISSCKKSETTSAVNNTSMFSTNDIVGVWNGDFTFSGVGLQPVIKNKKMTFGPNGVFLSMEPSPVYLSISGSLTVASDGKISGIITTMHKTDSVNVETTTMNWTGSTFETTSKINISMNWPWENTAPGHGNYLITGFIIKQ
jgi:hypothetical protein